MASQQTEGTTSAKEAANEADNLEADLEVADIEASASTSKMMEVDREAFYSMRDELEASRKQQMAISEQLASLQTSIEQFKDSKPPGYRGGLIHAAAWTRTAQGRTRVFTPRGYAAKRPLEGQST